MNNAKIDASLYILTNLLQHLEKNNPGLIENIISRVKEDQTLIPSDAPEKEYLGEIFKESHVLLQVASLTIPDDEAA